jgi:hypothetical protein
MLNAQGQLAHGAVEDVAIQAAGHAFMISDAPQPGPLLARAIHLGGRSGQEIPKFRGVSDLRRSTAKGSAGGRQGQQVQMVISQSRQQCSATGVQ